ncbi:MAG: aminopeptidase P family N-terminal domain-containing protein [Thermomicrobiales bacterium]
MPQIAYTEIALPNFGSPQTEPEIPVAVYEARLRETRERFAYSGYDALLVYGDREHVANIAYLTGYDPRFEEALLILAPGRPPTLLVGNEGMAYAALSPVPVERVLYQSFSLPGQPRGASKPLATILR